MKLMKRRMWDQDEVEEDEEDVIDLMEGEMEVIADEEGLEDGGMHTETAEDAAALDATLDAEAATE